MLALIAGTGGLPSALLERLQTPPLVCAMMGFQPDIPVDLHFRIEHLGSFLKQLQERGITELCLAGAVRRPQVDPAEIDPETLPLVPQIQQAIAQGDDGALRIIMRVIEDHGITLKAAHEIAPDLLPPSGVLTQAQPSTAHKNDADTAESCLSEMGKRDQGQACLVKDGQVIAQETQDGTDAMIAAFGCTGAALFKAPKPEQDRRADLPVIGPNTVKAAISAGLSGLIIEAGGVIVLEQDKVISLLNEAGLFLWVRPKGAQ